MNDLSTQRTDLVKLLSLEVVHLRNGREYGYA
jgi:hypothetical protein